MKSNVTATFCGNTSKPPVLAAPLKIVIDVPTTMPSALIAAMLLGLKLADKELVVPPLERLRVAALTEPIERIETIAAAAPKAGTFLARERSTLKS